MYFVSPTVVGWVDLFTRVELKHMVVESLRYCQANKGC
jgi:putative transposase